MITIFIPILYMSTLCIMYNVFNNRYNSLQEQQKSDMEKIQNDILCNKNQMNVMNALNKEALKTLCDNFEKYKLAIINQLSNVKIMHTVSKDILEKKQEDLQQSVEELKTSLEKFNSSFEEYKETNEFYYDLQNINSIHDGFKKDLELVRRDLKDDIQRIHRILSDFIEK